MSRPALPDSSEAAGRSKDVYARVMAANRQEAVDEVPPVVWASEPFLSGYAGVGRQEYYESVEAKYYAQARFQLEFPDILHLPGVAPDYGYAPETSAWGSPIKQEEDGPLVPFAAVNDIHDLTALEMPDPWTSGHMAIALNDYAWYADHMDPVIAQTWGHFEGYGRCMGVESGALVLGYERYLIELYEHPKLIHDWNKRVVEANIAYVRAQESITGTIDRLVVTDHLPGQVGQAHCEEFIYPYLKDIFDAFSSATFRLYHNENLVPDAAVAAIADMNCTVFMFGIEMDVSPPSTSAGASASWATSRPSTSSSTSNRLKSPADCKERLAIRRTFGRHAALHRRRPLPGHPRRPHPRLRRLSSRSPRRRRPTPQLAGHSPNRAKHRTRADPTLTGLPRGGGSLWSDSVPLSDPSSLCPELGEQPSALKTDRPGPDLHALRGARQIRPSSAEIGEGSSAPPASGLAEASLSERTSPLFSRITGVSRHALRLRSVSFTVGRRSAPANPAGS